MAYGVHVEVLFFSQISCSVPFMDQHGTWVPKQEMIYLLLTQKVTLDDEEKPLFTQAANKWSRRMVPV
jgi:hypothetical protein